MFELCIRNDNNRKWLTLIGGFLVHFALGSFYSASNMGPYIIVRLFTNLIFLFFKFTTYIYFNISQSYLREYRKLNVRYSDLTYMNTPVDAILTLSNVVSGILISKNIITPKQSILIGLILFRLIFFRSRNLKRKYLFTLKTTYLIIVLVHH